MTETYPTDLTAIQRMLVKANLNGNIPTLRKYDFFEVLNAIEITSVWRLFGAFCQVSSVIMPALFPHRLAKIPRKYATLRLQFFLNAA